MIKKALIIIVVLAVAFGLWKAFSPDSQPEPDGQEQTQNQGSNTPADQAGDEEATEGTVWTGTLQKSTLPSRGNIMLLMGDSDRIVYIRTSRDFSDLFGKEVKVRVNGDFNGFELLNIEAVE